MGYLKMEGALPLTGALLLQSPSLFLEKLLIFLAVLGWSGESHLDKVRGVPSVNPLSPPEGSSQPDVCSFPCLVWLAVVVQMCPSCI